MHTRENIPEKVYLHLKANLLFYDTIIFASIRCIMQLNTSDRSVTQIVFTIRSKQSGYSIVTANLSAMIKF